MVNATMDTVNVEWDKGVIRFDQIKDFKSENLDKKGFYTILGWTFDETSKKWKDLKLLYIGQAFDQTLRERIPQEHDAYNCVYDYKKNHSGTSLFVMIGIIKESSVEKQTQQLFNDIECCLIFRNKPACNTTCQESYSGRDLEVTNTGDYVPLKEKCSCSAQQQKTN
jgi:hypothetical protein